VTGIFRFLKPGGSSCCLESGNRRLDVRGFPKALHEYQERTMSCGCIGGPPNEIMEAVLRDGLHGFGEWEIEHGG